MNKWEELYNSSTNLTIPTSIKALFKEEAQSEIHDSLLELFRNLLTSRKANQGLKIYIDQKLRNDVADALMDNPPMGDVNLESWSKGVFRDHKYGIGLNFLEGESNHFAEKTLELVNPLLSLAGLPIGGISFSFDMGNIGFEPIGIKKNNPGEERFILHFGPGKKQFYIWDESKMNEIKQNPQEYQFFDKILSKADLYELEAGDVLFIPHGVYHISNSEHFSINLALDFINPTPDLLESQLVIEAVKTSASSVKAYLDPIPNDSSAESLANILNMDSIRLKLEASLRNRIYNLKSNAGLLRKSNKIKENILPSPEMKLKSKSAFPLLKETTLKGMDVVYARGHEFMVNQNMKLNIIIDELNRGDVLSVQSIQDRLVPEMALLDIYGLIADLLKVEAIVVSE